MIVDVIKNYVNLSKKGNAYVGLCPFHNDTKPSLVVSENKKCFKCFACGEGGSDIKFVAKMENISFNEAKHKINNILGFEKYTYNSNETNKKEIKYHGLLEKYSSLTKLFLTSYKEDTSGINYLMSRGINLESIDKYNLGYTPNHKNLLIELINNNYDGKDSSTGLIYYGLSNISAQGEIISSFQSRIIFPIINRSKQIEGFTTRDITNKAEAKYLNSLNLKKEIFYGIDQINNDVDAIYIFEGIIDCIIANQLGFNAIATMGINYSKDQLMSLKQFKNLKQVYICFDNDSAGFNASINLFKDLRQLDKRITIGFIDYYNIKEKDICDINLNHPELAKFLLNNCVDLNVFKLNHYLNECDPKKTNDWLFIDNEINISKSIFKNIIIQRLEENGFDNIVLKYSNNRIYDFLYENQELISDDLKDKLNNEFKINLTK